MNERLKITLFFALIFCGVGLRLLCRDLPNFAPVAALSLFAGFIFRIWWFAILVPLSVLSITNIYLGGYESWPVMVSVYSCLLLPALAGRRFLQSGEHHAASLKAVVGFSLMGSILFFFVTNYAAWVQWYPCTWSGFVECYAAAVPFFRYTLAGDLFFGALFFGGHAVVVHWLNARQSAPMLAAQA